MHHIPDSPTPKDDLSAASTLRSSRRETKGPAQKKIKSTPPADLSNEPPPPFERKAKKMKRALLTNSCSKDTDFTDFAVETAKASHPLADIPEAPLHVSKKLQAIFDYGVQKKATHPFIFKDKGDTLRVYYDDAHLPHVAHKVRRIAKGGMKSVHLYADSQTGTRFALEKIRTKGRSQAVIEKNNRDLLDELTCLQIIHSTLGEEIRGIQPLPHRIYQVNTTHNTTSISVGVLETDLYDGALSSYIYDDKGVVTDVPLKKKLEICSTLMEACSQLHKMGIVHQDIKPGNILIKKDSQGLPHAPVLIDFGCWSVYDKEKFFTQLKTTVSESSLSDRIHTRKWGTRTYISIEEKSKQGLPCEPGQDVFAAGKTVIEFLTGQREYFTHTPVGVAAVKTKKLNRSLKKLGLSDTLRKCLILSVSIASKLRPTAEELSKTLLMETLLLEIP